MVELARREIVAATADVLPGMRNELSTSASPRVEVEPQNKKLFLLVHTRGEAVDVRIRHVYDTLSLADIRPGTQSSARCFARREPAAGRRQILHI